MPTVKTRNVLRVLVVFTAVMLAACGADHGASRLADRLSSDYTVEGIFTLNTGDGVTEGTLRAFREDAITTLTFLSPETLSDITVTSDASGDADVVVFEYEGLRVPLADRGLWGINALLSFVSADKPFLIRGEKGTPTDGVYQNSAAPEPTPYTLSFAQGEAVYTYVYDSKSGMPLAVTYAEGERSVRMDITKFKAQEPA